jgi:polyhydroxybutyrate depolymerase
MVNAPCLSLMLLGRDNRWRYGTLKKYWRRTLLIVPLILIVLPVGIYFSVGPAPACSFPTQGPVQHGLSARTLMSSGVERCYLLYTPPGYDRTDPTPIVFSLHGFAGTPQGLRKMTGWESVADREGFLVVYPHGSSFPLRWNTSPAAKIDHINDVDLIGDILDDLAEIAAVDKDRVYVTGFSQGGTLTGKIACQLADRVVAVGMVSGKDEGDPSLCNPSRPVPVIAFFGTDDPLDDIERYPSWFYRLMNILPDEDYYKYLPLDEWVEGWVQRNDCSTTPLTIPPIGDMSGFGYKDCRENVEIAVYLIDGGGHTWPGGENLSAFGTTSAVSASEMMWEFFEAYSMTDEP